MSTNQKKDYLISKLFMTLGFSSGIIMGLMMKLKEKGVPEYQLNELTEKINKLDMQVDDLLKESDYT